MNARRLLLVGAAAAALAAAGCGDSPEDNAHDSGRDVGKALKAITAASSAEEVQAGVQQLGHAVSNVSDDVSGRVKKQVQAQRDHVNKIIGEVRGALAAPDTADAARANVEDEVQSMRAQAGSFASTRDSVTNAFWDGVRDGYDD